jgi:hypothetical protein
MRTALKGVKEALLRVLMQVELDGPGWSGGMKRTGKTSELEFPALNFI